MVNDENTTLADEIITLVQSEANNNPAPLRCKVIYVYNDNRVDVNLIQSNNVMKQVECIGEPKLDSNGVLIFINGDENNQLCIIENDTTESVILALGVGKFTISNDGDLYVELPNGVENPFSIDENGDLIVELPDGATNDYEINENGDLIYDRWDV